jgi:transposase InsO family protein
LFGKTKQAYYKKQKSIYKASVEESIVLDIVKNHRKKMPRIGTRKLQAKLKSQGIRTGRDALFNILRTHNMLIRRKRTKVFTTQSFHWFRKYPNLIKGLEVTGPNQLWVSDITYIETSEGFVYLFLVTDAYSRKIIGYVVSDNLEAKNAVKALQMALKKLPEQPEGLIHHSDRGIQYCCNEYIKLLKKHEISISMTQKGDPLENAIAERVNGILKTEWIYDEQFDTIRQVAKRIKEIVYAYNELRPHLSIEMLTPSQAHEKEGKLKRHWKNYYKKKEESENKNAKNSECFISLRSITHSEFLNKGKEYYF